MSNFEQAAKLKLRFNTPLGTVATEDLWDLPMTALNTVAKELNKSLKETDEEDFLEELSKEDTLTKLKFDLVLHVLNLKKTEKRNSADAIVNKAKRDKLLSILANKQDASLEELSEEQLKAEIEKLK